MPHQKHIKVSIPNWLIDIIKPSPRETKKHRVDGNYIYGQRVQRTNLFVIKFVMASSVAIK